MTRKVLSLQQFFAILCNVGLLTQEIQKFGRKIVISESYTNSNFFEKWKKFFDNNIFPVNATVLKYFGNKGVRFFARRFKMQVSTSFPIIWFNIKEYLHLKLAQFEIKSTGL